jgi:hypothetical protein
LVGNPVCPATPVWNAWRASELDIIKNFLYISQARLETSDKFL